MMWDATEIRRGNLVMHIAQHLVEQARRSVAGMSAEDRARALDYSNIRLDRITRKIEDGTAREWQSNSAATDLVLWHVLQEQQA